MTYKTRALMVILTAGLLVVQGAQVASAHDRGLYLADDPAKQSAQWDGPENFVYQYWHSGDDAWWAAVVPGIRDDALAVIGNWQGAIPELPLVEKPLANADLYFHYTFCPPPTDKACYIVTDVYEDPSKEANYVIEAQIRIEPGSWTTEQRREALAHELGHFYGLHERYIHTGDPENPSACNGEGLGLVEYTVMDTIKEGTLDHCDDVQGPQSDDIERVDVYWGWGTNWWLPMTAPAERRG